MPIFLFSYFPILIYKQRTFDTEIKMSAAKNWCFTINNYLPDDMEKLEVMFNHGHFNYLVFGEEIAPTTGTPHLQGYVQMKKKMRLAQVKKFISPRANLQNSRGSPEQASAYRLNNSINIQVLQKRC